MIAVIGGHLPQFKCDLQHFSTPERAEKTVTTLTSNQEHQQQNILYVHRTDNRSRSFVFAILTQLKLIDYIHYACNPLTLDKSHTQMSLHNIITSLLKLIQSVNSL